MSLGETLDFRVGSEMKVMARCCSAIRRIPIRFLKARSKKTEMSSGLR